MKRWEIFAAVVLTVVTCLGMGGVAVLIGIGTAESEFRQKSESLQRNLAQRFGSAEAVLTSLVGLHHSRDSLRPYEFAAQARELLSAYPFISAIAKLEKVTREDRAGFEETMRQSGFIGFSLKQFGKGGKLVRAKDRPLNMPIRTLEPFEPRLASLIGFDIYSSDELFGAAQAAISSNAVVVSDTVTLPNGKTCLFLLKPYYLGNGAPDTPEQRLAQTGGLIALIIDPKRYFNGLFSGFDEFSFTLYHQRSDGAGSDEPIFERMARKRDHLFPYLGQFQATLSLFDGWPSYSFEVDAYPRDESVPFWLVFLLMAIALLVCGSLVLALRNYRIGRLYELESERSRRENEKRVRDYAEVSSDWFWSADSDLRFDYISKDPATASGEQFQAVLGRTLNDPLGFEPQEELARQHMADLHARRAFKDIRHKFVDRSGQTQWWSISGKPVFDEEGRFVGYRGTGRNVTLQVESHQALEKSKEDAVLANRAKSEFLANVSHELRTPLNAIIGFSEMITAQTFGPLGQKKYIDYADDIHKSGQHLLALINDILDLSKVESGVDELYEDEIEISEVAVSLLRLIKHHADKGRIRLVSELAPGLPRLVADPRKVKQILVNLLSNAVKFTRPEGAVTLAAWCDQFDRIVFEIRDTGIGMTPEGVEQAMIKFRQVDSDLNRKFAGTGLGLPLARSLAELHGGTLEIASRLGEGTSVTIRFPAFRTARTNAAGAAPSAAVAQSV